MGEHIFYVAQTKCFLQTQGAHFFRYANISPTIREGQFSYAAKEENFVCFNYRVTCRLRENKKLSSTPARHFVDLTKDPTTFAAN